MRLIAITHQATSWLSVVQTSACWILLFIKDSNPPAGQPLVINQLKRPLFKNIIRATTPPARCPHELYFQKNGWWWACMWLCMTTSHCKSYCMLCLYVSSPVLACGTYHLPLHIGMRELFCFYNCMLACHHPSTCQSQ